jgi:hypothetical protein
VQVLGVTAKAGEADAAILPLKNIHAAQPVDTVDRTQNQVFPNHSSPPAARVKKPTSKLYKTFGKGR